MRLGGDVRLLRSVALPGTITADSVATDARLSAMSRQLTEVRTLAEERTAALIRDRASVRDDVARREARDGAVIRDLEATVETLQTKLTGLTRGKCAEGIDES